MSELSFAHLLRSLRQVKEPIPLARTLPREAYVSEEWYRLEQERIFGKCWFFVGRTSQVGSVGDFFTTQIGDDPIVFVRASESKVEGLINVCRHRGSVVVQKPDGNLKAFSCPYHGWTYSLEGSLTGCPGLDWRDMEGVEGFDPKEFGLHSVRVESWKGLLFVNFDEDAEPLGSYLGDLPEPFKRWQIEEVPMTHQRDYEFKVNWKIFTDNMSEQYHVPYVHKETLYSDVAWKSVETKGNWLVAHQVPKSATGWVSDKNLPKWKGVGEDEMGDSWFLFLYPSTIIVLSPFQFTVGNIIPTSVASSRNHVTFSFPDSPSMSPAYMQQVYDYLHRLFWIEDGPAQEAVQRGLMSRRGLRPGDGRFSLAPEKGLYHFHNWVVDRMAEG